MRGLVLGAGAVLLAGCGGAPGYDEPANLCETSKDQKSVQWTDFPEKAERAGTWIGVGENHTNQG